MNKSSIKLKDYFHPITILLFGAVPVVFIESFGALFGASTEITYGIFLAFMGLIAISGLVNP